MIEIYRKWGESSILLEERAYFFNREKSRDSLAEDAIGAAKQLDLFLFSQETPESNPGSNPYCFNL
jgi:hypothetical protein